MIAWPLLCLILFASADTDAVARAWAMPGNGWAPLTVHLSSFGSSGFRGITSLRWDLDADGVFETDATGTEGYSSITFEKAGEYPVVLQITDAIGQVSHDTLSVIVRDPALSSVDYRQIFDDTHVGRVEIRITAENWKLMWSDPSAEIEVPADAVILGDTLSTIGFSMRGHRSLWESGLKKPWRIDTNAFVPGQEFRNLKQLLFNNFFNDPSMIREKLAFDMLRFAGVPASHIRYVEFWIGSDDAPLEFWGVYSMVERVDRKFLANRFGRENRSGNLYKAYAWEEGSADLHYWGEVIDDYPTPHGHACYRLMSGDTLPDYEDVINLCRIVDGIEYGSGGEFRAALEDVFGVDGFLRYMACVVMCSNLDIYPYTGNNYFLFHNPESDLFEWIPWDVNDSWGLFGPPDMQATHPLYSLHGREPGLALYRRVFAEPEYRLAFAAYVDLLRREFFNLEFIGSRARELHDLLAPCVMNGDRMYFGETAAFPIESFHENWEKTVYLGNGRFVFGVVSLTEKRIEYIDSHVAEYLFEREDD